MSPFCSYQGFGTKENPGLKEGVASIVPAANPRRRAVSSIPWQMVARTVPEGF
jgi:hypothetical protein